MLVSQSDFIKIFGHQQKVAVIFTLVPSGGLQSSKYGFSVSRFFELLMGYELCGFDAFAIMCKCHVTAILELAVSFFFRI